VARILIVEDEPQVLTLATSVLQQAGHEVISAATLSEAEAIIDDTAQQFDLLFTEVELGNEKESGITLGKLIEETRPGIPVLYTSGRALTDGMLTLFVAPSAFLPKPYTAQELTEAVEKLFSLET
jgi:two-component system cell cycle sensor histidine kinase/response regulator CckA